MPKEITHLAIARASARLVPEESIFHQPVRQYPNLFLYGAIAPDTCFYYFFGFCLKQVAAAGNVFHVPDKRALIPVLRLIHRYGSAPDMLAFAAGVCCHLVTDTRFHPMVFFHCGMDGLHPGAPSRHRAFETAMDLHFAHEHPADCGKEMRFYRIARKLDISGLRLGKFLGEMFAPGRNNPLKKHLIPAFYFHRAGTRLFDNYPAYRILTALLHADVQAAEPFQTLAYPSRTPVHLKFFDGPLKYRDPESGQLFSAPIREMGQDACQAAIQLLDVLCRQILSGRDIRKVLGDPALPEIRPCPPGDAGRFRYWSGNEDLISNLYQGMKV